MEDDCFTVMNESLREPRAASETGTSPHLQSEEEWTVMLVMQHMEHVIISKLPLFGIKLCWFWPKLDHQSLKIKSK